MAIEAATKPAAAMTVMTTANGAVATVRPAAAAATPPTTSSSLIADHDQAEARRERGAEGGQHERRGADEGVLERITAARRPCRWPRRRQWAP